jgi:hypothetical protein
MPKPSPIPDYMKRVPGRKAPYEIALEKEEAAARKARANPVIRDGGTYFRPNPVQYRLMFLPADFQYRLPRPNEPSLPERPLEFSTF